MSDVSEELTASVFSLTVFDEDAQQIGNKEPAVYTGRVQVILAFQSSDWSKFLQISCIVDSFLLFA